MEVSNKEIIDFFKNMRPCSNFDQEKVVAEEDMKTILEAGRLSSSSFGLEPWKFLVIENKFMKKQIYSLCWGAKKNTGNGSYIVIILTRQGKHMKYYSKYVRYMMEEIQGISRNEINIKLDQYKLFLENNFEISKDDRPLFDWNSKQSYLALGNMMVAANSLGISSYPIEGFNKKELEELLEHEELLDEDEYGISSIISFGYEKFKNPKEKKRRPFEEVVHWVK